MVGWMRNNFALLFDAQSASEEAFFGRFARAFLPKRSSNGEFGERLGGRLFFMNI
jgi:hypothetical protein